jgi:hypothetical protein
MFNHFNNSNSTEKSLLVSEILIKDVALLKQIIKTYILVLDELESATKNNHEFKKNSLKDLEKELKVLLTLGLKKRFSRYTNNQD